MSSDISGTRAPERLPGNYAAILEVIRNADDGVHLSAHAVYAAVRRRRPAIGFATVHRGLARLHELGYVVKLDVPGANAALYECAGSPHAHFRCTMCLQISDVEFTVSDAEIGALAGRLGLQIVAETTTFSGRCAMCALAAL